VDASFSDLVNCPAAAFVTRTSNIAGGTSALARRKRKVYPVFLPDDFQVNRMYVGIKDRYKI